MARRLEPLGSFTVACVAGGLVALALYLVL
jgi:hypothetical protein